MSIFGTASKGNGGHISSVTTQAASAVNTQSGDLLVVCVIWNATVSGTVSVSDTAGNTFTAGGTTIQSHQTQQFFYKIGAAANATNVVTASVSGSAGMAYMSVFVWSVPLSGSCVFDVEAGAASSGTSSAPVTGSFNTTGTDELVLVASGNDFSGITYTAGTGYTLDSAGYDSSNKLAGAEHRLFSSVQTGITASFTQSGSTDWTIRAIGFKASSSPPPSSNTGNQIIFLGW